MYDAYAYVKAFPGVFLASVPFASPLKPATGAMACSSGHVCPTLVESDAKRALRRCAKESNGEVDVNNPRHMDAYLALRAQTKRPRVDQVVAMIRRHETELSKGARAVDEFTLVPRANFPTIPKWLAPYIRLEKDLRECFEVPEGQIDFEEFYVVDPGMPRQRLGLRTRRVELYQTLQHITRWSANETAEGPCSNSSQPPLALEDQRLPRAPAMDPPPAKDAEEQDRDAKRRRLLKQLNSESMSDEEATTLQTLVAKIRKARSEGRYWSQNNANANTVHFWAEQVVGSLPAIGQDPEAMLIRDSFPAFLVNVIVDAPCYPYLQHFVNILEALEAMQCKMPVTTHALRAMSKLELKANAALDLSTLPLKSTIKFYDSALFKSFQEARVKALLTAGSGARSLKDRLENLAAMTGAVDGLENADLANEVSRAVALFGSGLAAGEQLSLALDDVAYVRTAQRFVVIEDDGVKWSAVSIFTDVAASFANIKYDDFLVNADLVLTGKLRKKCTNPIVNSVLDLWHGFASFSARPWHDALRQTAASVRLNPMTWESPPVDLADVNAKEASELQKLLSKLVPGSLKNGPLADVSKELLCLVKKAT